MIGAIRRSAAFALLFVVAGCGGSSTAKEQGAAPAPTGGEVPFDAGLSMQELMAHVVQYSAEGIWERQGFEVDAKGEHSLFPKDDAEWEKAEGAALTLAEVTNTLLVPGRRVPEAEWDKAVIGVRRIAREAAKAAEKHDKEAFFAAGEKLDAACDACHARYDPKFDPRFQH
ncbi:MAG TPA: hypothetical protein VM662_15545 [Sphingomonas sp.]|nr:hypothetical protein [Sphingomonas sp.]